MCSLSDLKTQENKTAEVPKLTESSPAHATVFNGAGKAQQSTLTDTTTDSKLSS